MSVFNIIALFGGLALFLYGMRLMSTGLKEGSTGTLKRVMEKVTNNLFKAFLLGLCVTALIQSSTATIVITSGLVAANIISLKQSVGIIVGANVGTTVTGQIIRLMDLNASSTAWLQFFKPATLAPIALIIGIVLIMFMNFSKSDVIGEICMGFGILFTGLMNMTNAVSVLSDSGAFDPIFSLLGENPIVGYLIGAGVAFTLQSSSATIGILQAFSISGQLYFKSIYSVIVGIYLGDCLTTAIVCSVGAKADAKRVGVINVLFNLSETVLVLVGVSIANGFGLLDGLWNTTVNSGIIANTNTVFNLSCALILFPIVKYYEKFSRIIVKDDDTKAKKYSSTVAALDSKFYVTPALAFGSAFNVLKVQFNVAKENIERAFSLLYKYDDKLLKEIDDEEENIDYLTDKIEKYLLGLNAYISADDQLRIMNEYHNLLIQFERLGDYASNISEHAKKLHDDGIKFTEEAYKEISVLQQLIYEIIRFSETAFTKRDLDAANHIEPLEEVVDDLVDALGDNHLKRLEKGECNIELGTIFLNLLSDIERISDTCSNIGETIVARVLPQYAGKMHKYMAELHEGGNEFFDIHYNAAHEKYFGALEEDMKG